MSRRRPTRDPDAPPRLPRGKGLSLRSADLVRIAMFATLLVLVIVLGRPCAEGTATFVQSFSPPPDAAPQIEYERLTPEQIRRRFGGAPPDAAPAQR